LQYSLLIAILRHKQMCHTKHAFQYIWEACVLYQEVVKPGSSVRVHKPVSGCVLHTVPWLVVCSWLRPHFSDITSCTWPSSGKLMKMPLWACICIQMLYLIP